MRPLYLYSLSLCFYLKVEVYVNGIPAKCSGDCGFAWDPMTTPVIRATSPSQGNLLLFNLEDGVEDNQQKCKF